MSKPKYITVSEVTGYKIARLMERQEKLQAQLQLMQSQANHLQMLLTETKKDTASLIESAGLKNLRLGSIVLENEGGYSTGTVLDPEGKPFPVPEPAPAEAPPQAADAVPVTG
jgi:hypothetical protein